MSGYIIHTLACAKCGYDWMTFDGKCGQCHSQLIELGDGDWKKVMGDIPVYELKLVGRKMLP